MGRGGSTAALPVLLAGALRRRSASAVAALLPVLVWLNLFGGLLSDKSHPGSDLVVASHIVDADNPDPVGTARETWPPPARTCRHWRS